MRRALIALVALAALVAQPLGQPVAALAAEAEPAPVVTAPEDGSATTDRTPTVRGTAAHDDSDVYVELDGAVPARPQAHGTDWSWTVPDDLRTGRHTVRAFSVGAAGRSEPSATVTFEVRDAPVPGVPVLREPADGGVVPRTSSASGSVTKGETPTTAVEVVVDDGEPAPASVQQRSWSFSLSGLDLGTHTLRVRAVAEDGTRSGYADAVTVTVVEGELPPVITSPVDGSRIADRTPVVRGTAAHEDSDVWVEIDGARQRRPQARGTSWSWFLPDELEPGEHTLRAYSRSRVFGRSETSREVVFEVREKGPGAPTVDEPAEGAAVGPVGRASGTLSDEGTPTARVRLRVDGRVVDAQVDGSRWIADLPELEPGRHTLTVRAVDADDTESDESEARSFSVDDGESVPVVVSPSEGSATSDRTPTVLGTAAHDDSVVHLSLDGRDDVAKASGRQWSWTVPDDLEPGRHTLRAYAESAAGRSPWSEPREFEVREKGPAAPVVTLPEDGSTVSGDVVVAGVAPSDGTNPAVVRVFVDGAEVGKAEVRDREWRLDLPTPASGKHTVLAQAVDDEGTASALSEPSTFVVRAGNAPPVVTTPRDGSGTVERRPVVRGTAGTDDSEVHVELDGREPERPAARGTRWSWVVPDELEVGSHTVRAYAVSEREGRTGWSEPVRFEVREKGPGTPDVERPAEGEELGGPGTAAGRVSEDGTRTTEVRVLVDDVEAGRADLEDGRWSFALPRLVNGKHTVAAQAVDEAGTTSPVSGATTFGVAVDLYPPTVASPRDGAVLAGPPEVVGEGTAGATVYVLLDDQVVAKAPVDRDGRWFLRAEELGAGEGRHRLAAFQVDRLGHRSEPSAATTFVVDTIAPDAPTIDDPADGARLRETTFTVAGRGEPGTTAEVLVDSAVGGSVPVDGDGRWALVGLPTPERGEHTVTARLVDGAGNRSEPARPVGVVAETPPPAPVLAPFAGGSPTREATALVEGTGEPGAKVAVYLDGSQVDAVETTKQGTWRVELAPGDGSFVVSARAFDAYGGSEESNRRTLVIDTTVPDAPTIDDPADGSTTGSTRPTFRGRGEPGAQVELSLDGRPLGERGDPVVVDEGGSWTYDWRDGRLGKGRYDLGAGQLDAAGNESDLARSVFVVDPSRPVSVLAVVGPEDGTDVEARVPVVGTADPGATVRVRVGGVEVGSALVEPDGGFALTTSRLEPGRRVLDVTQTPVGGSESDPVQVGVTVRGADPDPVVPDPPVVSTPEPGSTVGSSFEVAGTGLGGARVEVSDGGAVVGTTTVGPDGTWSLRVGRLPDGPAALSVVQIGGAGPSGPTSVRVTVDARPPGIPVLTAPADGSVVADSRGLSVEGTAEPGALVTVLDDGEVLGTALVGKDGTFSLAVGQLASGPHHLSARARDRVGNPSEESRAVLLVVADRPVVTRPADGSATSTRRPTFSGTGVPGTEVSVRVVTSGATGRALALLPARVAGDVLGAGPVGPDGTWSLAAVADLPHGVYTVVADQRPAGVTLTSLPVTFAVASEPVITSPADRARVRTPFRVCGTGEPGWVVTVLDVDDSLVTEAGRATVDVDGTWCAEAADDVGLRVLLAEQRSGDYVLDGPAIVVEVLDADDPGGPGGGSAEPSSGTGSGTTPSALAATGAPAPYAGLVGLVLSLAGAGLLVGRRRRAPGVVARR